MLDHRSGWIESWSHGRKRFQTDGRQRSDTFHRPTSLRDAAIWMIGERAQCGPPSPSLRRPVRQTPSCHVESGSCRKTSLTIRQRSEQQKATVRDSSTAVGMTKISRQQSYSIACLLPIGRKRSFLAISGQAVRYPERGQAILLRRCSNEA